jgi:glucokinase
MSAPTQKAIGIDLGGTKIAAGAVDVATGEVTAQEVVPTEAHHGPSSVIERMARVVQSVRRKLGNDDVIACGLGLPGLLDLAAGETIFLPNLAGDWDHLPVAANLTEMTGLRTSLINDARAFTLAEATWGAGRGAYTVVGMTLGTGIGGGIAIGGRIHLGTDGSAGEVGHMTIEPEGADCGCGNRGCLETLTSGPAITALGVKAVLQGLTTKIGALVGQDLNRITPETIMRAAEDGDEVACKILNRVGANLGIGIASLVTILNPNRVVIGGGVARLGDWLLGPAREEVRIRCHVTPLETLKIVPAALGENAGLVGAAMWAVHRLQDGN